MQQENELLKKLGYNVGDMRISILKDMIFEVRDALDEYEEEEVIKILNDKQSYLYVEVGHFCYEIGLKEVVEQLNKLHNERIYENIDAELYSNVYKTKENPSLEESILSISRYIKYTQEKESSVTLKQKKLIRN